MSAVVVVGAQWGDEGKGKITDFLAGDAEMVVRYQGGPNAGHTVWVNDQQYKLHLVPSGILYPGKACVIGNGVVVDPEVLVAELDYLAARGVDTGSLAISDSAHVIMPYHRVLDGLEEERRGEGRIGTTRRGVGPAYMDKLARIGIRVADLLDPPTFSAKLEQNLREKNTLLERVYGVEGFEKEAIFQRYLALAERFKDRVTDTSVVVNEALDAGRHVLFEGAQGTLLDIDHGTYPFVTSSHPVAAGACLGAGVGPTRIDTVIGVAKAYTTRVGEGPFPTELTGDVGHWIRERGHEYGTATGRPRRVGWLDTVILRYAARVSGLAALAITRLDTLGGLDRVRVAVEYRYDGRTLRHFPHSLKVLAGCEPVYEDLDGWDEDITGLGDLASLPPAARRYLERIEALTGLEVAIVSIGRERAQTIARSNPSQRISARRA